MILLAQHFGDRIVCDVRVVLAKIHDDLSGDHDLAVFFLGDDGGLFDTVMVTYHTHDPFRRDNIVLFRIDHILESVLGIFKRDLHVIEPGICGDLFDGSLKFADIGFNVGGNILEDLVIHIKMGILHILAEDRHTGLIARRLNVRDQSPFETGAETLIQCLHLFGRTIGGKNDLFSCLVELIEGVEELLLRRFFSYYKLYVIDQQNIYCSVLVAKSCHGRGITASNGFDHFIGELLGCDVQYSHAGILLENKMADRVHKVRLAQSGPSVKKKRVVSIARRFRDSKACGMREHIVAADDESIETVFGMKMSILYFDPVRRSDRFRLFIRRSFFIIQYETDIIFFSQKL